MESTSSAAIDSGRDLSGANANTRIAALRAQGAHRSDPVRFRYLEALARRAAVLQGEPRRVLDATLSQLLEAVAQHTDALRTEWDQCVPAMAQRYPHAADELHRLRADTDANALRRRMAQLQSQPRGNLLSDLLRHIAQQAPAPTQPAAAGRGSAAHGGSGASLADLKTVQRDKDAWTRLRVELQLARSQAQAPDNPGPLNSHLLVLRSLRRMQTIAPEYLAQFMLYAETLLWLDQCASGSVLVVPKMTRPAAEPKKPLRARAGRRIR